MRLPIYKHAGKVIPVIDHPYFWLPLGTSGDLHCNPTKMVTVSMWLCFAHVTYLAFALSPKARARQSCHRPNI